MINSGISRWTKSSYSTIHLHIFLFIIYFVSNTEFMHPWYEIRHLPFIRLPVPPPLSHPFLHVHLSGTLLDYSFEVPLFYSVWKQTTFLLTNCNGETISKRVRNGRNNSSIISDKNRGVGWLNWVINVIERLRNEYAKS